MKSKIISFGILGVLVIVAGISLNQNKTTEQITLSAESTSPTDLPTDLGSDQYAVSAVRIGEKTFNVELALTREQQSLGLGERDSLPANSGMLFVFKPAEIVPFWMKGMRFNLDIVWISEGNIVDITRNAPVPKPETKTENLPLYSPKTEIDYVLELNAGAADKMNVGDRVEIVNSSQV